MLQSLHGLLIILVRKLPQHFLIGSPSSASRCNFKGRDFRNVAYPKLRNILKMIRGIHIFRKVDSLLLQLLYLSADSCQLFIRNLRKLTFSCNCLLSDPALFLLRFLCRRLSSNHIVHSRLNILFHFLRKILFQIVKTVSASIYFVQMEMEVQSIPYRLNVRQTVPMSGPLPIGIQDPGVHHLVLISLLGKKLRFLPLLICPRLLFRLLFAPLGHIGKVVGLRLCSRRHGITILPEVEPEGFIA